MKTRVMNEQTRCSVAGGEESFVLDFLFLEPVLSFCRRVARQKKNTQFLNHLICGFIGSHVFYREQLYLGEQLFKSKKEKFHIFYPS